MYLINYFIVDWDKVTTIEDIKTVLKELRLGVDSPSDEFVKLAKYVNKNTGEEVELPTQKPKQ